MTLLQKLGAYEPRPVRWLMALFVVAFLARIVAALFYYSLTGSVGWSDDWEYLRYAQAVLATGPAVPQMGLDGSWVGPGWPLMLAVIMWLSGGGYWLAFVFNALFGATSCVLLFRIADSLFNRRIALLSSAWLMIYVPSMIYVPTLLKENFTIMHLALIVYLALTVRSAARPMFRVVLLAAVFTWFLHVDERYLIYTPVLLLWVVFARQGTARQRVALAAVFVVTFIVVMVPWQVRNAQVYKRFILLTPRMEMVTSRLPIIGTDSPLVQFEYFDRHIAPAVIDSLAAGHDVVSIPAGEARRIRTAISYGLHPHDYGFWERVYEESVEYWAAFRFRAALIADGYVLEPPWKLHRNVAYILCYGMLLPFFVIGTGFLIRRRMWWHLLLPGLLLVNYLVHVLVVFAIYRYRVQLDFLLIMIAMFGVQALLDLRKPRPADAPDPTSTP